MYIRVGEGWIINEYQHSHNKQLYETVATLCTGISDHDTDLAIKP